MPGYNKHASPNFSQNEIKGWSTRLIYSLYNSPATPFVEVNDYTENLFDRIQSVSTFYKGSNRFPASSNRFFKTGKNFRIKARFLVTTVPASGGPIFNIRAGMTNESMGTTIISLTNNGQNHTPPAELIICPIDLEIIYTIVEQDDQVLFSQANGNYMYDYTYYNTGTKNIAVCYVPIWKAEVFSEIGPNTVENSFYLDFGGSFDMQSIKVLYLFIEELT